MSEADRRTWEAHWDAMGGASSLFGRIASFVRLQLLSRALRHYASRYLGGGGPLLEAGCGSAQSSGRLGGMPRPRVALDFSLRALGAAREVPVFDAFLQGDLRRLPLRDASIAGAWNLGVMEHFDEPTGVEILRELRRVLVPGGHAVLFWPPWFGSSRLVLAPVEALLSLLRRRPVRFFPGEVNRFVSSARTRRMLALAGLEAAAIELSPRDLFVHVVVVARRPA